MKDSKELMKEILLEEEKVQFKRYKGWYDLRKEYFGNTLIVNEPVEKLESYLASLKERLNS